MTTNQSTWIDKVLDTREMRAVFQYMLQITNRQPWMLEPRSLSDPYLMAVECNLTVCKNNSSISVRFKRAQTTLARVMNMISTRQSSMGPWIPLRDSLEEKELVTLCRNSLTQTSVFMLCRFPAIPLLSRTVFSIRPS